MKQEEIGKFIAQCRKEKHLTQAQLAQQLGVTNKSISRWENGKTMMDLSLYEPLCKILDIQVSELLYAKRLTEEEKTKQGEQSALQILATKKQLETLNIFTQILVVVGIIITITFTNKYAHKPVDQIIIFSIGAFVWGFALVLRALIMKAINKLDQDIE